MHYSPTDTMQQHTLPESKVRIPPTDASRTHGSIAPFQAPECKPPDLIERRAATLTPLDKRTTTPYLTEYEFARILGTRALQIRSLFVLREQRVHICMQHGRTHNGGDRLSRH